MNPLLRHRQWPLLGLGLVIVAVLLLVGRHKLWRRLPLQPALSPTSTPSTRLKPNNRASQTAPVTRLVQRVAHAVRNGSPDEVQQALHTLQRANLARASLLDTQAALQQLLQLLANAENHWLGVERLAAVAAQARRLAHTLLLAAAHGSTPIGALQPMRRVLRHAVQQIHEAQQPACQLRFELEGIAAVLDALHTPATPSTPRLHDLHPLLTAGQQTTAMDSQIVAALYRRVNHSSHKQWYEVVLMLEFLQSQADHSAETLKQLQQLLHTHWQGSWQIGHAGISALAHAVAGSDDPQLQRQAYYGQQQSSGNAIHLPGLQDCLHFQQSRLRNNWRSRVAVVRQLQRLSSHTNRRIAFSAQTALTTLQGHEEDQRVLLPLKQPVTASLGKPALGGPAHGAAASNKTTAKRATPAQHNLPAFDIARFISRPELLTKISNHLSFTTPPSPHQSPLTRILTLHGMGGVGKTTLALAYAHRQLGYRYTSAWWINAESRASLIASVRSIARQTGMKSADTDKESHVLRHVNNHLSKSSSWLLVLDNVDEPQWLESLRDTNTGEHPLYPSRGGHILVTSRKADAINGLAVDVLTPQQAQDFLLTFRTPQNPQETQAMQQLAELHLGFLPLALAQVGAYVREYGESFLSYLQLHITYGQRLWRVAPTVASYNRHRALTTALGLNLAKIEKNYAVAAHLAHTMAYLDPDSVPKSLLARLEPDPLKLNQALGMLRRYSLIQARDRGEAYSMHRLQQAVIRDRLVADKRDTAILSQAVWLLEQDWNYDWNEMDTWTRTGQLVPQVRAVWVHVKIAKGHRKPLAKRMLPLVNELGDYLRGVGYSLNQAQFLLQQATQVAERIDPNSEVLASSYNYLGDTYIRNGLYKKAIPLHQKAIAILTEKQTQNDKIGLSYNHLGYAYDGMGQFDLAIEYYKKSLAKISRLTKNSNLLAASVYNRIGISCRKKNHYDKSINNLDMSLNIRKENLDESHIDLGSIYNNLGLCYTDKEEYKKAIMYHKKAFDVWSSVFGKRHSYIALNQSNFGFTHIGLGNYDLAMKMCNSSLDIRTELLAEKHPSLAQDHDCLGLSYYGKKGACAKAINHLHASLEIRKLRLGDKHPFTAWSNCALAAVYIEAGSLQKALKHLQESMGIEFNGHGNLCKHFSETYYHLGKIYTMQNKREEGIRYLTKALDIQQEKLESHHPIIQNTRAALAQLQYRSWWQRLWDKVSF